MDATQDEWVDFVQVKSLDRVKSLKLWFYCHTTRKYESLEKEIIQECVPARLQKLWSTTPALDRWYHMQINKVATAGEYRDHWRGIVRAANPSYEGRHWTTTTTSFRWLCQWSQKLFFSRFQCFLTIEWVIEINLKSRQTPPNKTERHSVGLRQYRQTTLTINFLF